MKLVKEKENNKCRVRYFIDTLENDVDINVLKNIEYGVFYNPESVSEIEVDRTWLLTMLRRYKDKYPKEKFEELISEEKNQLLGIAEFKDEIIYREIYRKKYPFHGLIIGIIEGRIPLPEKHIYKTLESGVDINCLDCNHNTPLDILLNYGASTDTIRYFLEKGAKLGLGKKRQEDEI